MTKEYEYKLLALDSRDYITNKIIFSMLDDENLERRFSKFQEEIFSLKSNLVDDLSDKNIRYNDFRNAITPTPKIREEYTFLIQVKSHPNGTAITCLVCSQI
ncbi:hypothetical protein P3T51_02060 [Weissella confusa]|uniref:hypothetical protein n=1 Tax=Weissella confusa TaxID=1583 RepID=UPI002407A5CB|nr:hypothetical protein [Weissella confusa]WEY48555.1 hypothetical protein P3T51_02060 [Weissella confusa]